MAPRAAKAQAAVPVEEASVAAKSSCPIDALNAKTIEKLGDEARLRKQIGDLAVDAVKIHHTPVYHRRSMLAVYSYILLAGSAYLYAPSAAYAVAALLVAWVAVDLYGAVLHVVLDHADFIPLPMIGAGCLEFQWHHAIPSDIVSKPYFEVLGDLNYVALLHFIWHGVAFGGYNNRNANVLAASKGLMAYLGQWSHRMAHSLPKDRPQWVVWAQWAGILVDPKVHAVHHAVYNDAFPILSGFTAPLISGLLYVMPDRRLWLVLFVILSLTDIYVMHHALVAVFNYAGINIDA